MNRLFRLFVTLIASLGAAPATAQLACSTLEASSQLVSINEVRSSGSNPNSNPAEFVELYFFRAVTTDGWRLCVDKNPSPQCVSIPNATYPAGDFYIVTSLPVTPSGSEFVLCDKTGGSSCGSGTGILDHLSFDNGGRCGTQWSPAAACTSGCVSVSSSLKDLARVPDGTGSWVNTNNNTADSSNGGSATLHHLRLLHDGSGLTCNAESVTLQACANAACSSLVTSSVTATPTASAGIGASFTPSPVTFTGGSTTLSLRATSAGTTTLGATASSPTASSTTRCFIGASESCSMTFADSGLLLSVPDHVSDTSTSFTVAAVRKSDNSLACTPAFANVSRSIAFHSAYQNPATGTLPVSVNGSSVAGAAPGTAISLSFNASGQASASLRYADVGQLQLTASYSGSAGNGDSGLALTGNDSFVVRPAGFTVTASGNPGVATPAGAAGEVFARAGRPFALQVTARNSSGNATPNFGRESPAEGVQLSTALVAPLGGRSLDVVGSPGFGAFSAGSSSGNWIWDEVGAITVTPRLADGSYLGSGDAVGTASGTIGRFVPDHLRVNAGVATLQGSCASGSFSYFGEAFGYAVGSEPSLTVSAHSASSGNPVTQNYDGAHWRLNASLSGRSYSDTASATALSVDSSAASVSVSSATTPPFDGSQTWRVLGERLTVPRMATPQAPLDAQVRMALLASDLTDLDGVCHDSNVDGVCEPLTIDASASLALRWGRLAIDNAFGPELFDLNVPLRAEYFDGSRFLPHAADSCSRISSFTLSEVDAADGLLPADTCALDSGQPGLSGIGCTAAAAATRQYQDLPAAGQYRLWLRAPGAGRTGVLALTPTTPDYLRFDWTGSGPSAPSARISFGIFAGDKQQIYSREVY